MKKLKQIALIFGSFLILLCFACILYRPLYYRLYLGDRIKGTISVKVDDKKYPIDYANFGDNIEHDTSGRYHLDNDTIQINFHDNKYGSHTITLYVPIGTENDLQPIKVDCFQHNWWSVQRFDLLIQVDNKNQTISYLGECTTIGEHGEKLHDSIEMIQSQNEYLHIGLGL